MFEGQPTNLPEEEESLKLLFDRLKWSEISDVFNSITDVRRAYLTGGFTLKRENKTRSRNVFRKYFKDNPERSDTLKINLFMTWYSRQEGFGEDIDEYFQSDAYQTLVEEKGLDENFYHLTDEKLEEFSSRWSRDNARLLLFFSPIKFSESQAEVVAEIEGDVVEKRVEKSPKKEVLDEVRRSLKSAEKENRSLKKDLKKERAELRHLEGEMKGVSKEAETLRGEKERLANQLEELKCQADSHSGAVRELHSKIRGLENEKRGLVDEREKNHKRINSLKEKVEETERRLLNISRESPIDRILLDQSKLRSLFSAVHEESEVLSVFENLLKEKTESGTGTNFPEFWEQLGRKEQEKVRALSQISSVDMDKEKFATSWSDTEDLFKDLEYLAQAKLALIGAIHRLFREVAFGLDLPGKDGGANS